jgi:hypothetical protein
MSRSLEVSTLDSAARHYAGEWLRPDRKSPSGQVFVGGPSYVMQDLHNATFKDEHESLVRGVKEWLGGKALAEFEQKAKEVFAPREDTVFHQLLREHLAIDPDGNHIPGTIGKVQIGSRIIGVRPKVVKTRRFGEIILPKNEYWPVYAGEPEERDAKSTRPDPLPEGAEPWPLEILQATNPNISAEAAIAGLDAIVARLDEGATAATIRGRTGAQPADPDAAESGTLLFTLTMSDPAFTGAADDSPGALATASAITDDASADATNTLTYCRVGATGAGADDHIDGSAGTAAADFIFNTVAIVSGATVSMSSFTILLPQGATAT